MKPNGLHWLGFALPLVLLMAGGCTLKAGGSATAESNAIFTQAALTLEARITQSAGNPQITPTPLGPLQGTPVGLPSARPSPGASGSANFCDRAKFVEDVTIPDGSLFSPGESFVKVWRIQNDGTCTWTSGYTVVFDSGDALGSPASFQLTSQSVPPGGEVEISLTLVAPQDPGTYRGDWKLRNSAGQTFGLGTQAESTFWLIIEVGSGPQFDLAFDNIHDCSGVAHVILRVENTGASDLESAQITLTDIDSGSVIFGPNANNGPFMGTSGECPQGADAIEPGEIGYLGGSLGTSAPSGHSIRADIKICDSDGLSGACQEQSLEFNIP